MVLGMGDGTERSECTESYFVCLLGQGDKDVDVHRYSQVVRKHEVD